MAGVTKTREVAGDDTAVGKKKSGAQKRKEKRRTVELSDHAKMVMRQHHRSFNWVSEHREELQKDYDGKIIAVHNRRVVGSGDTRKEALAQAKHEKCPLEEVVVVTMLPAGAEFPPDKI